MGDETRREDATKEPTDRIQDGRVKATIWERDGETGPAFATKITRTYTDKEGQPRDTSYFSGADLLRAARVAEKAYEREAELKRERAQGRGPDNTQSHEEARDRGTRRAQHRQSRTRRDVRQDRGSPER